MNTKLYPPATLETVSFVEERLEEKWLIKSASTIRIKFFKRWSLKSFENWKSGQKYKKYQKRFFFFASIDTFLNLFFSTSKSIPLSCTGFVLLAVTISTSVAFGLPLIKTVIYRLLFKEHNRIKKPHAWAQQTIYSFDKFHWKICKVERLIKKNRILSPYILEKIKRILPLSYLEQLPRTIFFVKNYGNLIL